MQLEVLQSSSEGLSESVAESVGGEYSLRGIASSVEKGLCRLSWLWNAGACESLSGVVSVGTCAAE